MHQRYAEFQNLLVPAITRVFEPQKGEPEAGTLMKKRITLRLLTELFLAGVFSDASVIYSIVKDLVCLAFSIYIWGGNAAWKD
jgi:hypothetical protein